tara:strand:+ start:2124 stop:2732 length:609 start_codon:yes stop_codon:yes gene_type:complete
MGLTMSEDIDELEGVAAAMEKTIEKKHDETLIRYIATLLVKGKSEREIKRTLNDNSLISSRIAPHDYRSLMRQSAILADDIRWMVVSKAEMEDIEQQRIDSYARRKRALARLEAVVESAHGMSDSVGKLNQVSFMVGGLIKAQESMDKFTGAQEATPQVVVNVGYDPLTQFREVIQDELEVIDVIEQPTRIDFDGPDETEEE